MDFSPIEEDVTETVLICHIQADKNICGSLAFRLIGNRQIGIFVYTVNEGSHQSSSLQEGDELLFCNDIPLRGFTCEQVAKIIRTSLLHRDTVLLAVMRKPEMKTTINTRKLSARLEVEKAKVENMPNRNYLHGMRSTIHASTSENVIIRHKLDESDNYTHTNENYPHSRLSFVMTMPREDSVPLIRSMHETIPDEEIMSNGDFGRSRCRLFRCPICLKYSQVPTLHLLKHRWLSSAKKLLPMSTSEYFALRNT